MFATAAAAAATVVACSLLATGATATHWAPIKSPTFESNAVVLEVGFTPDGKVGYAGGGDSAGGAQIIKTEDSGVTWDVVWPANRSKWQMNLFLSSAVRDDTHAIVGGAFFQTWTSDGKTFLPAANFFGSPPQDAAVIPGSGSFALVSGKETVAGGNSIGVSTSGGKYTRLPIPDDVVNSTNFLARYGAFVSKDVWYISAGSFPSGSDSAGNNPRRSKHFTVDEVTMSTEFHEIPPQGPQKGDSGYSAAIVKTTDGGATWELVYKNYNTGDNIYPNGVHCWTADHCVAVLEGDSARIIVTRDGGKTWNETMHDADPHSSLMAVRMLSDTEVWVAGGHPETGAFEGRFFHSLDGGNTWEKEAFPGTYFISLDMVSAESGYAVALTQAQPAGLKLFKYQGSGDSAAN